MAKNIVVCCDGTANEFAKDNTNVVKLYYALEQDSAAPCDLLPSRAWNDGASWGADDVCAKFTKLLGMALGYGSFEGHSGRVHVLMERFEPGDKMFRLGFSRGAYTVRAVASLLSDVWTDPVWQ